MDPESVDVTAGLEGFLAFFLLAVALYLLMRNMNARMQRMAYREEQAAKERADGRPASDEPPEPDGPEPDGPDSSGPEVGPDLG